MEIITYVQECKIVTKGSVAEYMVNVKCIFNERSGPGFATTYSISWDAVSPSIPYTLHIII